MKMIFPSQVAHFYNTIDQQMIPSQQAMMLDTALAFEKLIKKPKAGSKKGQELGVQVGTPFEVPRLFLV